MSEKTTSVEIISTTENAVSDFNDGIKATERSIWQEVLVSLGSLKLGSGIIIPNTENLGVLRSVQNKLKSIVVNDTYRKRVNKFIGNFDVLKGINDKFLANDPGFNPNSAVLKEVLRSSVNLTKESLLASGIDQQVIQPVANILKDGITSGSSLVEMEGTLRTTILGDANRLGQLERYTSQITRDALNQFSRNYSQSVAASTGMEWYFYSGSVIEDTREYCQERAGKYFHKKEVERVPSQWAGKIPGTNAGNIFINAGGFNCRHTYLPVLINVVPRSVVERNVNNGNFRE